MSKESKNLESFICITFEIHQKKCHYYYFICDTSKFFHSTFQELQDNGNFFAIMNWHFRIDVKFFKVQIVVVVFDVIEFFVLVESTQQAFYVRRKPWTLSN